jgi:hypothetical protein
MVMNQTQPDDNKIITSLHLNPFYILGATTRDHIQSIVELADERCLITDHGACMKSSADLTNPRTRLSAEIAWLPGLSPTQATQAVEILESNPGTIFESSFPDLACANIYASAIELLSHETNLKEWVDWIIEFAFSVDAIKIDDVIRDINEDRRISGFPEIRSPELVESELVERRRFYKDTVKNAINNLPTLTMVETVTNVVKYFIEDGDVDTPALVDDIIDCYEIEAHDFLNSEADNIIKLIEIARHSIPNGENAVEQVLIKIDSVLKNWHRFAKPIQLSMKSRGLNHELSNKLAYLIRSFGIDVYNEHDMIDATHHITLLLKDVFFDLPEFADRLTEDSTTLNNMLNHKQKLEQEAEELAQEISYSAEIGLIIKDKLAISPSCIQYCNQIFPLDSINKVRWGFTRHSVNFIPTGTTYSIFIGNKENSALIKTRNGKIYNEFTSRLWRAVCVNMLFAMVSDMADGAKYIFGDAVVDNLGAELTRHRFLKPKERVYATWDNIRAWSADGRYHLGLDGDKANTYSSMSYIHDNNVHILAAAIDFIFKNGGTSLSAILN